MFQKALVCPSQFAGNSSPAKALNQLGAQTGEQGQVTKTLISCEPDYHHKGEDELARSKVSADPFTPISDVIMVSRLAESGSAQCTSACPTPPKNRKNKKERQWMQKRAVLREP